MYIHLAYSPFCTPDHRSCTNVCATTARRKPADWKYMSRKSSLPRGQQ